MDDALPKKKEQIIMAEKKVLVTGAGGFIGSHLCERLVEEGYRVRAFVLYNSQNSWEWLDHSPIKKEIEVVSGDIRDQDSVEKAVKGMDQVFHLAALISIPYSYTTQQGFVGVNIKGTLNVLQASLACNIEKVLVTSTSEVYGTARYVPIDEKHPRQGQSPYSASKIGADALAESFHRSFKLPVTVVRPFNTYGPRQSARAVIPTIITQLLSGNTRIKLGALHPTRDLVYVKDTAQGFIRIACSENSIGEQINIATGNEISIKDLAEKIMLLTGKKAEIVADSQRIRPEKSEVERLLGSSEKLNSLTGWQPSCTLEQGLQETIQWFSDKGNLALYKPDTYNI